MRTPSSIPVVRPAAGRLSSLWPPSGWGLGLVNGLGWTGLARLDAVGGLPHVSVFVLLGAGLALVLAGIAGAYVWLRLRRSPPAPVASTRTSHGTDASPPAPALDAALDAQRRAYAREIHDGPLQDLFAARLFIAAAVDGPAARELDGRLVAIQTELRAICEGDRPAALRGGIGAALQRHVRQRTRAAPAVDLRCTVPPDEPPLPDAVRRAVFRIAQEALSNALRHSGAACVSVDLVVLDAWLVLTVSDDGCGFDAQTRRRADSAPRPDGGGRGLRGMRDRAADVGARLDVTSAPHAGTCVTLRVPVRRPDAAAPLGRSVPVVSTPWTDAAGASSTDALSPDALSPDALSPGAFSLDPFSLDPPPDAPCR